MQPCRSEVGTKSATSADGRTTAKITTTATSFEAAPTVQKAWTKRATDTYDEVELDNRTCRPPKRIDALISAQARAEPTADSITVRDDAPMAAAHARRQMRTSDNWARCGLIQVPARPAHLRIQYQVAWAKQGHVPVRDMS
jgi:hypothetical protein